VSHPHEERETKIRVQADRTKDMLARLGADLTADRAFEENWVYDTPDLRLRQEGYLLRLRHAGNGWTLTLKAPGREEAGHKIRPEHETSVRSGEVVRETFRVLGLETVWRYQKYRTHYELHGVKVSLDETPMGDFLELEGPAGATEEVARQLGHDASEFVDLSYGRLWRESGGEGDLLFPEELRP